MYQEFKLFVIISFIIYDVTHIIIICHGASLEEPLLATLGLVPASLVSVNRHSHSRH